jgi:YHS domain-containing protein/thiol-disulfide isomerase/thioredoxin
MSIPAQRCLFALFLSSALFARPVLASDEGPVQWRHEFTAAAKECQRTGRLLLIQVGASWCAPCRQMHQTTWRDSRLAQAVNAQTIPVSLDADKNAALLAQWSVTSLPTTLFVTPSGQIVQKIEGKAGAIDCLQALQRAQQRYGQMPKPEIVASPRTEVASPADKQTAEVKQTSDEQSHSDSRPEMPTPTSKSARSPVASATAAPPLALEGNCPVTMIEQAEMVAGKTTESVIHGGRRYLFASARQKQKFLAAPAKYAPGEAGRCVVTFAEHGRWIDGDMAWPAIYGDKVFFLASDSLRKKFLADPERYVDDRGQAHKVLAAGPTAGARR